MGERPLRISRAGFLAGIPAAVELAKAGSVPRAVAAYQDRPMRGARCADCRYWVMGKVPSGFGTCRIVQGPISANGWCKFFSQAATKP